MENPNFSDSTSSPQAGPSTSSGSSTNNNTLMAVLSYVGPLVVIELIVFAASMIAPFFFMILGLINLGTFILSIVGIVWAVQGKQQALPVVGKFAEHFKF